MPPAQQVIHRLARQKGLVRLRDAKARGIHPEYLRRLASKGELTRVGRGLYALPNAEITEHHSLAEVAARVPQGVVCLLTALRFHGLGSQNPKKVWLAIDRKAALPRLKYPPVRIVRFAKPALTQGIEERRLEGVLVRLTTPARTVVDCSSIATRSAWTSPWRPCGPIIVERTSSSTTFGSTQLCSVSHGS